MASGPDHPADMPSTTTSCPISSMPLEQLARPDHSERSLPMAASVTASGAISPSASPIPSALAPRDRPMDFSVSEVAQVSPRPCASATRAAVRSGHLT